MKKLIIFLALLPSFTFGTFTSGNNCEEITISEEHHYLKEPLEWNDLKKIGDAPIQGVNKSFICEDTKGESWYVKPSNDSQLINSYLISRLMEKLTEGTELKGMTVDIRLIKGAPEMMVDGSSKTPIASRTLSNFKTGYHTPSAPVKAKSFENLLASILDVYDRHLDNLGYLAFEDKWVPIMIDVDVSDILIFKEHDSCPFGVKIRSEMDAETWEYVKRLANFSDKEIKAIKGIIHGAFADIAAVGFEISSFEETVYKNLDRTHQTIRALDQLVSNPCVSSALVEACTETVASLIKEFEPIYGPGCYQLPQNSRMSSWIAKLLMMHRDLDQPETAFSGDFFEHLELTPESDIAPSGTDISNFFMVPLLLNYGKIKENFIKMIESHTPLTNEKKKLYSVDKNVLNLSIDRNEWVILKFILEDTDVKSEDLGAALMLATAQGKVAGVDLLIKAEAPLDVQDEFGHTALMLATEGGHVEIVDLLIKAGAHLDAQNTLRVNALMMAAERAHVEIVDRLLQARADLEVKNGFEHTVLMLAAKEGHVEIVDRLIQAGADFEAKDTVTYTILMQVVGHGYVEIVKLLIKAGANLEAENNWGETALTIAEAFGLCRKEIADLLREAAKKQVLK